MKIFSWMHSKLTGKQEIKKENMAAMITNHTRQDSRGDEFSDWPYELLAIGTFGNDDKLKQKSDKSHLGDDLQDISSEEVSELQKEITHILDKQKGEEFLEIYDSLNILEDDQSNNEEANKSMVINKEKDTRADKRKGSIGKKSLSFILKKMLVCRSGLSLTQSLRDPIPDKSRMEKILRAILHKKIYLQNSNPKATAKKYLNSTNQFYSSDSDDEMLDAENDGNKWDKTDSDFIVLEI